QMPSGARNGASAPASAGNTYAPLTTPPASASAPRAPLLRSSRLTMVSLLIGIALAAGASTLYSLGIAVQALDARDASRRYALRISLLAHLVTRARWLFGTGMTVLG